MSDHATMPCPFCDGTGELTTRHECLCNGTGELSRFVEIEDDWLDYQPPNVDEKRMREIRQMDLEQWAADVIDFEDITGNITERLSQQYAERMDKELHGAWRAGYGYLHVYQEPLTHGLAREPLAESVTFSHYVLPSNNDHPTTSDDLQYSHTYDIGSVPDYVIRAAVKGELDSLERINPDR